MKINKLVKVGEKTITNTIIVDDYDVDGNVIGQHDEIVIKVVPVMEAQTVDMTPEEEAEVLSLQAEAEEAEANREPTFEEQMEARLLYLELMTGLLDEEV